MDLEYLWVLVQVFLVQIRLFCWFRIVLGLQMWLLHLLPGLVCPWWFLMFWLQPRSSLCEALPGSWLMFTWWSSPDRGRPCYWSMFFFHESALIQTLNIQTFHLWSSVDDRLWGGHHRVFSPWRTWTCFMVFLQQTDGLTQKTENIIFSRLYQNENKNIWIFTCVEFRICSFWYLLTNMKHFHHILVFVDASVSDRCFRSEHDGHKGLVH